MKINTVMSRGSDIEANGGYCKASREVDTCETPHFHLKEPAPRVITPSAPIVPTSDVTTPRGGRVARDSAPSLPTPPAAPTAPPAAITPSQRPSVSPHQGSTFSPMGTSERKFFQTRSPFFDVNPAISAPTDGIIGDEEATMAIPPPPSTWLMPLPTPLADGFQKWVSLNGRTPVMPDLSKCDVHTTAFAEGHVRHVAPVLPGAQRQEVPAAAQA